MSEEMLEESKKKKCRKRAKNQSQTRVNTMD